MNHAWTLLPQLKAPHLGQLTHCICELLLVLHVELYLLVGVIRDNVLMGVAIHLDEITQGNFFVSLGPGEYSCKELIGGVGQWQGQSFPSTGEDLIEGTSRTMRI
jgi:hypothetical protein